MSERRGVTIEKTTEDKVREQFSELTAWQLKFAVEDDYTRADARVDGFIMALNTLGIKIEGVNA